LYGYIFADYFICTQVEQLAITIDKVYQLLVQGRWFSPGTPASSTNKTGCYDIAEILLKMALKHQTSINQSKWLRVECTLFVIYKAGREPTPYW
jgi:hypothetical protein